MTSKGTLISRSSVCILRRPVASKAALSSRWAPQNAMALQITVQHNAFHIVGKHNLGHSHVHKGVDHPNEQVFLPGVGEKLNVPLTAVVTDHGEACCTVGISVIVQHICEAPVHLVGLARRCGVTAPSVSLRRHLLPLGRYEMLVGGNVFFYNGGSSVKTGLLQTL